jgi:O-antigen ligase
MKVLEVLFGQNLGIATVIIQSLFGMVTLYFFYLKLNHVIRIPLWLRIIVGILLLVPYFPPFLIAHNIASEGLAYPLYLWMLYYTINTFWLRKSQHLIYFCIAFLGLVLTRGQFVIIAPILAVIYLIWQRKKDGVRKKLFTCAILFSLPFLAITLDATFKKMVYGLFTTSPYTFVNAVAMPLFLSNWDDRTAIKDSDDRAIFEESYRFIDSLDLLASKVRQGPQAQYQLFHDNFPRICNQNIHDYGKRYYRQQGFELGPEFIKIENTCKNLYFILVGENWKQYLVLYTTGLSYGFGSYWICLLAFILFGYTIVVFLKNPTDETALLFFFATLVMSNALVTAFACHSIQRYLFYNYFIECLLLFLIGKKIYLRYAS